MSRNILRHTAIIVSSFQLSVRRVNGAWLMLQFQVPGPQICAQGVLSGSRPFEVRRESGAGVTEGPGVQVADFYGSVYGAVIVGVRDCNFDVPSLAVDILVPRDARDLQIAPAKAHDEIRRFRNFDSRLKIIVRRISDC